MNQQLKSTKDRKTAFWPTQRNTFGLLPGREGTCPFCTLGPGGCAYTPPGRKLPVCYAFGVMHAYSGVRPVLEHNTDLLHLPDSSNSPRLQQRVINILKDEFKRFRDTELRHAKQTGTAPQLFYRLHWSGDISNMQYAVCLSTAMNSFPDVRFWGYTRSLPYAAWLASNTSNLTLYLSLDRVNLDQGLLTYYDWRQTRDALDAKNLVISYMSAEEDFAVEYGRAYWRRKIAAVLTGADGHADWPAPGSEPKLRICPADAGKLAVDGACAKCRGCISDSPMMVWFKS